METTSIFKKKYVVWTMLCLHIMVGVGAVSQALENETWMQVIQSPKLIFLMLISAGNAGIAFLSSSAESLKK